MMAAMQLSSLANNFGWQLLGDDCAIESVSIDSRKPLKGSLFVALRGDNFDGHDYISQAQQAGAVAVLVETKADVSVPQLICDDSLKGLASLAQFNIQRFERPVITLTGSAGKTTTKAMIAHILASQAPTLATTGNLNNEIGAPLTALAISAEHRFAVVEMGAAKQGDIAYLCRYIKPTIALVTNAGDAHIGGFGSEQGIAEGKGEIYEALGASDTAVINADSPYETYWQNKAGGAHIIRFGCGVNADVRADDIQHNLTGSRFTLSFDGQQARVQLNMPGQHNVMNALAAVTCCIAVGIKLDVIARSLHGFTGVGARLSFVGGIHGAKIINDTYNANPSAFRAAIDVLAYASGEKVLVMGAMAELGERSDQSHRDIARYALDAGVSRLLAVGKETQVAVEEFGINATWYETKQVLVAALSAQMTKEQTILVKGSRSAGMETVVNSITDNTEANVSNTRGGTC